MTKKTFLSVFILIFSISAFAQDKPDTIIATKVLGGYRFEQNGKHLRIKSLTSMMLNDP
jgi:hypothetical protein